jgi:hypothetical protein
MHGDKLRLMDPTAFSPGRVMNLLFLCLARNCEGTLPAFFEYLNSLERHGIHCTAIIGENGSSDDTRALIRKSGPQIELLDTSFMALVSSRLKRMAIGREAIADRARNRETNGAYVCVADLDNVMISPPTPQDVKRAIDRLREDTDLFAIGATSRPVYYDLLSLRAEGHDYTTLNGEIQKAKRNPLTYYGFHKQHIYKNQISMTVFHPIICASSFNAFCLYNASDYVLGTYRSSEEDDVCEHVTLNLSIARATGKRMLISPDLIVRSPQDHSPVNLLRFWTDRIRRLPGEMTDRLVHFSMNAPGTAGRTPFGLPQQLLATLFRRSDL